MFYFSVFFLVSWFLIVLHDVKKSSQYIPFVIPFRFFIGSYRVADIALLIWMFHSTINLFLKKSKLQVKETFSLRMSLMILIIATIFNTLLKTLTTSLVSKNILIYSQDFVAYVFMLFFSLLLSIFMTKDSLNRFVKNWIVMSTTVSSISYANYVLSGYGFKTIFQYSRLGVFEFYNAKFKSSELFFEDPNNYAGFLVLSFFITVYYKDLSKDGTKSKNQVFIFISLFLIGLSLLSTFSRSAYISLVIMLVYYIFKKIKKQKVFKIFFGFAVVLFGLPIGIKLIIKLFQKDFSAMTRVTLWKIGLLMMINNPILGVGLSNSQFLFPEYYSKYNFMTLPNTYAHNLFIRVGSELGFIYLLVFVLFFLKLIRNISKQEGLHALLAGLSAYLMQSLANEYLASRHFWIFVGFLIACENTSNYGEKGGIGCSS